MLTRKWRILVAGGLVAVLSAGVLEITSPHQQAATSIRVQHHASSAVLLGCGDLVGTAQWSGTYDTVSSTGAPIHGNWTGTWTVAPDGTVSGTVDSSITVSGIISCGTIDLSLNGANNQALGTYAVNGQTVPGSGTFVYNGYSGTWSGTTTSFLPTLSLTPSTLPVDSGPVTYTATLSGADPAATGEVDISDDQGASCSIASLTDGAGSCDLTEQASDSPYTVTASYLGDANDAPASTTLTNTSVVATGGTISTGSAQVQATAQGGTPGVDTLSETQYGTSPVGDLNDGTNYFDVAASSGNAFSSVVIQDCNNVTASSVLSWWDPTANSGAGGWSPVVGDPGPTYDPVAGCLSATLDATTVPTISQLTGTVFATSIPTPAITSAGGATAHAGTPFSLTVTTTGSPTPTLSESGKLPAGLHFQDNLDGTATLSGTPSGATVGGVYSPTFTATFGSGGTQQTVSQTLTLFVFAAPTFTSPSSTSVKVARTFNFVATAPGYPPAAITETGSLPRG